MDVWIFGHDKKGQLRAIKGIAKGSPATKVILVHTGIYGHYGFPLIHQWRVSHGKVISRTR